MSALDDAVVVKGGDLTRRKADLGEHFIGMLAESRRAMAHVARRFSEPHRRRGDVNGAAIIIHCFEQPARIHLSIA